MILDFWARWRWRIFVLIPLLFILGFSLVLSSDNLCMSHDFYLDKQHEARDTISLNNISVRTCFLLRILRSFKHISSKRTFNKASTTKHPRYNANIDSA
jgi:hypothetical protein